MLWPGWFGLRPQVGEGGGAGQEASSGGHGAPDRPVNLDEVEGLVTEQITLGDRSPFVNQTLGDTAARSRTGASIVAVVRDRQVFASPRPDFRFGAGDVVVVVGTAEGTSAVAQILTDG